ncbi:MAG: helix-turn-helix domain-containing protein [Bacteroidetes bacterium]|nr:helix-turn-helix domain-containing protein [Bacteroidota bacterium]MCH8525049.1 helix-turn-helix domain-containing protein [Balneolales bacterium]
MHIHPIHTQADYNNALSRIEEIFDAKPGTIEGDELEILGILVDEFEKRHFPVDAPDPIEAVKFRMEQLGLSQSDLAGFIGSKSRASEILSGKRTLSLKMIRLLHRKLNIPAEVLLQQ